SAGRLFLYQAKTGHPVLLPLPPEVLKALGECGNPYFHRGVGNLETATKKWQARLKKLFRLAGLKDGHAHRFRDTFAVRLLEKGVPLSEVSLLLGHTSIKTTEKSYAPWVHSRQLALEAAVKKSWS